MSAVAALLSGIVIGGCIGLLVGSEVGVADGFKTACKDAGATYYRSPYGVRRCKAADEALKIQGLRRAAEVLEAGE